MAGFLSGDIGSGGLQGAMVGAFSAGVFHGIGPSMGDKVTAGKVLAHGKAGGVMSELQGGKFGHGFASAAVTQLMSPVISRVNDTDTDFNAGRVAVAALVGGTTSALTGGTFANEAATSAFSNALGSMARGGASEGEGEWIYPKGGSTDLNDYDTVMTNGILGD